MPLFDGVVVLPLRLWSISIDSLVTNTTLVFPFCCPFIYGAAADALVGVLIIVESLM